MKAHVYFKRQLVKTFTVNLHYICVWWLTIDEPRHEISNNVVCATNKGSDQPAHTHSLTRAFASRLHILGVLSY